MRRAGWGGLAVAGLAILALPAAAPRAAAGTAPVASVVVDPGRIVARFRPDLAFGGDLDGHGRGEIAQIYRQAPLGAMRAVGLGPVSYRLRTELGVQAWHWNPRGTWSDPAHRRGYWTSSDVPGPPILRSYGYDLPRRGDTTDQADDDGYSRIDDGSRATFWKSDPYLARRYTGEPDRLHPQWIVIDLGRRAPVDAVRIDWGTPFATRFRVQRWVGPRRGYLGEVTEGWWAPLGRRRTYAGRPGLQVVRLAARPVGAREIRILLLAGSGTAPPGSRDVRDRLGVAVREAGAGTLSAGRFDDRVHHSRSGDRQSAITVSSTDPWHRATDLDRDTEQPGLDLVFRSGLVRRGPGAMVPVATLYGTPADAVAELRYLRRRHRPVRWVELGEEPDGQLATPEDYAALYVEFARALRRVDPHIRTGGPGYQTAIPDWYGWPLARGGDWSWTRRFLTRLRARHALRELRFFSFEWYPFDDVCVPAGAQLARAPGLLRDALARQASEGLPRRIPRFITEYGWSAFAGRPEVQRAGALFDAEVPALLLSLGGRAAYVYGWEPDIPIYEPNRCHSWGNLILWRSDDAHRPLQPVAALWAERLLTHAWSGGGDRPVALLATTVPSAAGAADGPVRAYAVRRADGRLALMLLNTDPARAWLVRPRVGRAPLAGPARGWQMSSRTYVWHPAGPGGHAAPDAPPRTVRPGAQGGLRLPPLSLTVVVAAARWAPISSSRSGPRPHRSQPPHRTLPASPEPARVDRVHGVAPRREDRREEG